MFTSIYFIAQGADGVEYLMVAVNVGTLLDYLENEDADWDDRYELGLIFFFWLTKKKRVVWYWKCIYDVWKQH